MATVVDPIADALAEYEAGFTFARQISLPVEDRLKYLPRMPRAAGTLIAISLPAIVSGYSGEPSIETVSDGAVQLVDASPSASLLTTGPVSSLFQMDLLAVRLRLRASWASLPMARFN